MGNAIVWFRQDLRLNDNPALKLASDKANIIPVYILDDTLANKNKMGAASQWWLHHALMDLADSLDQQLIIEQGEPLAILRKLAKEHKAESIHWNRMYEPWATKRDKAIKSALKNDGFQVASYNGSLLWEPMDISKKDGTPYKVFTPYYRKGCLQAESPRYPLDRATVTCASSVKQATKADTKSQIEALNLLPKIKWDDGFYAQWTVSERAAQQRLQQFITESINNYADKRNIPSVAGTSKLSPYFRFGQLSPNQAWYAIHDSFHGNVSGQGVDTYLSELGWREFSYHLLYHFKDISHFNYNEKFNDFPWRHADKELHAWQQGLTGVPIVDAGMRELWQTGWMHNRVRMVVGSYLVKNLLLDWRVGERWFWDCLVDADTASNAASWQWVAGSGADAAPYFRIFNPILQGEKFDKEGEYVKQYCPELSKLPKKYIHKPWEAPTEILKQAGIELGIDYPKPIVDLKASRQRALDAYNKIK